MHEKNKTLVLLILCCLLLLCSCASIPEEVEAEYEEEKIDESLYGTYLPFTEEEIKNVYEQMQSSEQMTGRWIIPEDNIDVALYLPKDDQDSQRIVDAKDSASYFFGVSDGNQYIGDHNNQGFSAISDSTMSTKAYMIGKNFISQYCCIEVASGHNNGTNVVDADGNPIPKFDGIICYTCDDHWTNVKIVFFKYMKTIVWDLEEGET